MTYGNQILYGDQSAGREEIFTVDHDPRAALVKKNFCDRIKLTRDLFAIADRFVLSTQWRRKPGGRLAIKKTKFVLAADFPRPLSRLRTL